MPATWTRLPSEHGEICASASHERDARADWRMDAGDVGSYYCETCRYMIERGPRYFGRDVPIDSLPGFERGGPFNSKR